MRLSAGSWPKALAKEGAVDDGVAGFFMEGLATAALF
jgi:hypothetical protein